MENPETHDENLDLPIYNLSEDVQYDPVLLPTLVARIKAVFVDLIILLIVFVTVTIIVDALGDVPSFIKGFIAVFMLCLYDPILTSFTGGTLGHKIMKLKIKRFNESEKNISLVSAILRFLVKGMLGWISFLTVTGNKNKRAIHDIASGSIILQA